MPWPYLWVFRVQNANNEKHFDNDFLRSDSSLSGLMSFSFTASCCLYFYNIGSRRLSWRPVTFTMMHLLQPRWLNNNISSLNFSKTDAYSKIIRWFSRRLTTNVLPYLWIGVTHSYIPVFCLLPLPPFLPFLINNIDAFLKIHKYIFYADQF